MAEEASARLEQQELERGLLIEARAIIREFQRVFDEKPKELRTAERGEQEFLPLAAHTAENTDSRVTAELLRLRLVQRKLAADYDWRLANAIIKDGKITCESEQPLAEEYLDYVGKYEKALSLRTRRARPRRQPKGPKGNKP
jgi:hypothetical protein